MAFISDSIIYSLVLGSISLTLALYFYFTAKFNYWKDRGIPFVKPVPFFGNLKGQFLSTKHLLFVFQDIYDALKGCKYGGYFEMRNPALMVRDPELVQRILIKDFTHFYDRGFSTDPEYDPLSANLFNLQGGHWKYLRNKLTPTFTSGKLKGMFEQIHNCGEDLNRNIAEQSKSGQAVDLKPVITSFATDVIASCAFGLQMGKDDELTKNYQEVVTTFFGPSKKQALHQALLFYIPKVARKIGIKSVTAKTENIVLKIVRDTINFRQSTGTKRNDFLQLILNLRRQEQEGTLRGEPELEHDADDDIIDQMKHAVKDDDEQIIKETRKEFFSDAIIASQIFVFIIAGSDAISSPLCFALYELTRNPEIQEKAQNEIDSVLENHNHKWSYEAVKEMEYIDQILQETFRLNPVVIVLFRTCTKPYKIPGTDDVIEKGTRVIIPIYGIHTDPDNYKEPQVFDPARFANNNFKPSGTFMPFGDGPRICIAMRFAVLEMKIALAKILSEYTVKLSSKTKLPLKFIVPSQIPVPEGGWWFEFEKRKQR